MEEKTFKPKMRVKLLDKQGIVLQDRLVDQGIEFMSGPQVKHKGPLTLEFTLKDQGDVVKLKEYIERLTGDLPIMPRKVYAKKGAAPDLELYDAEPLKELVLEIEQKCKDQQQVINYLRERNFTILTPDFLSDYKLPIQLEDKDKKYQYLVRQLKEAKDPKADKYDPQLAVGVKLIGDKIEKVKIYLYGKFHKALSLPWPKETKINFKKIIFTVFPHYMVYEERTKWGLEQRKLLQNPKAKPSKFFLRWEKSILETNPHLKPISESREAAIEK